MPTFHDINIFSKNGIDIIVSTNADLNIDGYHFIGSRNPWNMEYSMNYTDTDTFFVERIV